MKNNAKLSLKKFVESKEKEKWNKRDNIITLVKDHLNEFKNNFKSIKSLYLVGSIAQKEFFSLDSDVDIATRGLDKNDYFKALLFWEDKLNMKVDFIRLEEVKKDNLNKLIKNRIIIYEKS
ncbi:MAG: nucleotidyltransferase domain-containing protein [Pseudomonadota bacterium]